MLIFQYCSNWREYRTYSSSGQSFSDRERVQQVKTRVKEHTAKTTEIFYNNVKFRYFTELYAEII